MVSPELGPAVDPRRALAAIVIASALLAEALAIADIRGIARTVAVLWFVGVCPGLSVVLLLSLDDRLMELLLSIALSVAIVLLVTTLMVFLGAWLPLWGLTVVVVLSVMLGAVTMARVGIHHEPGDAS